MFKKIIAFFLIFAMLVPFSAAAAADEPSESRSMEEILDEYHRRAFEARSQGDTRTVSVNARSGGKTLEEETVDALTSAGYEAYNVTADNYDTLEAKLNTDFADMGLDPNGSYIMVIHGEEPAVGGNSTSWVTPNPEIVQPPDDGGGSEFFSHTYNGQTYWMRYVTITSFQVADLRSNSVYILSQSEFPEFWSEIGDAFISFGIDELSKVPFASIFSLLGAVTTDSNHIILEDDDIVIISTSIWTLDRIQIWNFEENDWKTAQESAYANSGAYATGYIYDSETHTATPHTGEEITGTTYSPPLF